MRRDLLWKGLQAALGVVVLAWAALLIGSAEVLSTIGDARGLPLLAAIGAWACVGLLLATRLWHLLARAGHRLTLSRAVGVNLAGLILSDVTPGRVGYFAVLPLLAREGVPAKKSFAIVAGTQAIELILKVMVGALAVAFLVWTLPVEPGLRTALVAGVLALASVTLVGTAFVWGGRTATVKRVLSFLPLGSGLAERFAGMSAEARALRREIPLIFAVSVAGLFLAGAQWWLVGQAVGLELPFLVFVLLHPLVTALSFVPVGVAGLGIQESGLTLVLALLGAPLPLALAFALLARVTTVLADLPGAYVVVHRAAGSYAPAVT
ncbi:MAG TPA: lysylphosphatidylglycerol synthase transmembrane domain-containing protein [Candidatus Thermoplasmatota archaeon]|nr:lysylphosphatidylglycerol synthase transmembrane domain-containing protein [Candidatus Thermoplasmatota archaeon]